MAGPRGPAQFREGDGRVAACDPKVRACRPGACAAGARAARAEGYAFALETPEGAVIRNFSIPEALAPARPSRRSPCRRGEGCAGALRFFRLCLPLLPGGLAGARPSCWGRTSGLRVGLLHHPVLGARSEEAALAGVLAAQNLFGDAAALRLHARLIEQPGNTGAVKALALAGELGLDPDRLQPEAARKSTRAVLEAQAGRAVALGLRQTPAFVLGGYAFIGWPGPGNRAGFRAGAAALRRSRLSAGSAMRTAPPGLSAFPRRPWHTMATLSWPRQAWPRWRS